MKDNPLVAIYCLVYNHGSYIRDCLDGFVQQKTNFPFIAVVHDDCSTDNSAAIIREYEEKYPDIIKPIYEEENCWQNGLWDEADRKIKNTCSGVKYIAVCEGDDYWTDPYKLQKQVDFLETNPEYVACFHNVRVFNGRCYRLFNDINENHYPTTEDLIIRHWFIATPALLYRNILDLYPDWKNMVVNEDYLLELLLAQKGKFYYMDDVMAVYRQMGQGVSVGLNANKIKMYDGLIFLLTNMKEWYGGEYAESFDQSIANYQRMKADYKKELYFEDHPILKAFRPKTYKRLLKDWMRSIVN